MYRFDWSTRIDRKQWSSWPDRFHWQQWTGWTCRINGKYRLVQFVCICIVVHELCMSSECAFLCTRSSHRYTMKKSFSRHIQLFSWGVDYSCLIKVIHASFIHCCVHCCGLQMSHVSFSFRLLSLSDRIGLSQSSLLDRHSCLVYVIHAWYKLFMLGISYSCWV